MGKNNRERNDMEIEEMMRKEIEIPEKVDDSLKEAYGKIRSGEVRMKQLNGRRKRTVYKKAAVAAAAACLVIALSGVFYVNPALAKDIPILGDVFAKLKEVRDQTPYPEKDKTAYDKIAEHSKPVNDPTNTAEDQGISMEVSDVYCDGYDLYFTLSLKSEDEEMNTADKVDLLSYREGDPIPYFSWLTIDGEEVFPALTMSPKKTDDNVFVALVRVQSVGMPKGHFPEDMNVTVDVGAVSGHKNDEVETGNGAQSGFKRIEGSWKLAFTADVDTSNNSTIQPQAENNGFVAEEVTKTPSNTYVTMSVPAQWADRNPAAVLTDKAGNRIYNESNRVVEQEDGSWMEYMVFDDTDAGEFVLQVYDKNGEPDENGQPVLLAEIPFTME